MVTGLEIIVIPLIGAAFNVLLERLATRYVLNFFQEIDVEKKKKIEFLFVTIATVLTEAEDKKSTNQYLKWWLDELQDVFYEAENVLDEIYTEALKNKKYWEKTVFEKKIDDIINRLQYVAEHKDFLSLIQGLGGKTLSILPSTSSLAEREIFGRESDKAIMVNFLGGNQARQTNGEAPSANNNDGGPTAMAPSQNAVRATNGTPEQASEGMPAIGETPLANYKGSPTATNEIPLLAIVGMPGIGKTTLAQHMFSDEDGKLKDRFDIKVWIHIIKESSVVEVTKMIYESISCDCENDMKAKLDRLQVHHTANLDKLQDNLKTALAGKKLLLVLDDYWSEDYTEWDVLKKPFKFLDSESRIIITTRNRSVALMMRATIVHSLSILEDKYCWSIFKKYAFSSEINPQHPQIAAIRERILRKCRGLPLVAKTLATYLYSKQNIDDWVAAVHNEIWELPNVESNVLATLTLSYNHLPTHLKRCFAYCSIFPKGHKFLKADLISLWMAEGLLFQSNNKQQWESNYKQQWEVTGENYFNELWSRSFFQKRIEGGRSYFTMHDLFCDLAQNVAGQFYFKSEEGHFGKVPEKVRHVSFDAGKYVFNFDDFKSAKYLRTFFPLDPHPSNNARNLSLDHLQSLLVKFKGLRVLCLNAYIIDKLPESISELKLLRYLNLSGCKMSTFPTLGSLHYLETLLLSQCPNLKKLPNEITDLINLIQLDIVDTPVEGMPPQFSKLTKLNKLSTFVAGGKEYSRISQLKDLKNLGGKLSLLNLENVGIEEARTANLKEKCLRELLLNWNTATPNPKSVIDELKPHDRLEKLTLDNYGGEVFPNWLGHSSFSKIVTLRLVGCQNCLSSLHTLDQLSSLKELYVDGKGKVNTVDPNFSSNAVSSSSAPFKSLETITFTDMAYWETWSSQKLPNLQNLHLVKCPKLKNLPPPECFPSLKSLKISECHSFVLPGYKSLEKLEIKKVNMQASIILSNLINIKSIEIKNCQWGPTLQITQNLNFLGKISIIQCPNLQLYLNSSQTPILEMLKIANCNGLDSILEAIIHLTSLHTLEIQHCYTDLIRESFPGQNLRLPPKLTSLSISGFRDLKSLNCQGLQHLSNLRKLEVSDCNRLEAISGVRLPTSLVDLSINGCPQMTGRCQIGGDEWSKIVHIPKINIERRDVRDQ